MNFVARFRLFVTVMYFVHTFGFTFSLSGTKVNDPSAAKALGCFLEKATMLSSLM